MGSDSQSYWAAKIPDDLTRAYILQPQLLQTSIVLSIAQAVIYLQQCFNGVLVISDHIAIVVCKELGGEVLSLG